jgi:hypothetical protein
VSVSFGTPSFYHAAAAEGGVSTRDRAVRAYAGVSTSTLDDRFLDQFNGAGFSSLYPNLIPSIYTFALPRGAGVIPNCIGSPATISPFSAAPSTPGALPLPAGVRNDPGCLSTIAPDFGFASTVRDHEAVVNTHVAIPHRRDNGRDDLQLLYSATAMKTEYYGSPSDIGPALVAALFGRPAIWPDRFTFPRGTRFGDSAARLRAVPYLYPGSPSGRAFQAPSRTPRSPQVRRPSL